MKKREEIKKVQTPCIEWLGDEGYTVHRLGGDGWPDVVVLDHFLTNHFYIEFKDPKGELSNRQVRKIRKLTEEGATVYVVCSLAQLQEGLK